MSRVRFGIFAGHENIFPLFARLQRRRILPQASMLPCAPVASSAYIMNLPFCIPVPRHVAMVRWSLHCSCLAQPPDSPFPAQRHAHPACNFNPGIVIKAPPGYRAPLHHCNITHEHPNRKEFSAPQIPPKNKHKAFIADHVNYLYGYQRSIWFSDQRTGQSDL
jgi:hypothetical protein